MSAIKFTSESTVATPKTSGHYAIRKEDWIRIRKHVCAINPPDGRFQTYIGICAGIFTSCVFALISFWAVKGQQLVPGTVLVVFVIALASLIVGIICHFVEKTLKSSLQSNVAITLGEMDEIVSLMKEDELISEK